MGEKAQAWGSMAAGWGLRGKRRQWAWERAAWASLGAAGIDGLNKTEQSCSLEMQLLHFGSDVHSPRDGRK